MIRALLISLLIFSAVATPTYANVEDKGCEASLTGNIEVSESVSKEQAAAIQSFTEYFKYVSQHLVEREDIIGLVEVALLAKEHVLLMGPPGNAKSMISDMILGNIVDGDSKDKSYYRIQMTPETTMSETHGPLSPKEVFDSGRIVRHYDQGMLFSRNVFIDEIFDARANAQRNILGLLAERQHAQGTEIVPGKIETVVAATNKYLDEVYEKSGDQGPKALLDRFSFNIYVPGEFEHRESYNKVIQAAGKNRAAIPQLTFQQLDELRALTKEVEIPDAVADMLSVLSYRMKGQTESMEQAALKSYRKKLQNGDNPSPPYRATKYHSPRTLYKAAGILRAHIVADWIRTGGRRPLVATVDDIKALKSFFTLNGPSRSFVKEMLERTTNPYERSQLSNILEEDKIFEDTYGAILGEVNEVIYSFALTDLSDEVSQADSQEKKEKLAAKLMGLWQKIEERKNPTRQAEVTGQDIGYGVVVNFIKDKVHALVGKENFQKAYQAAIAEGQKRREEIERQEARRRAKEEADRIAREERERLRQMAAERQAKIDKFNAERLAVALHDPKAQLEVISDMPFLGFGMPEQGPMERGTVRVGDTSFIFNQADFFYRIEGGKATEVSYASITDASIKKLLSDTDGWQFFEVDKTSFAARRGNNVVVINSKDMTLRAHMTLEGGSNSRLALDKKRKRLYELNISNGQFKIYHLENGSSEVKSVPGGFTQHYTRFAGAQMYMDDKSDVLYYYNHDFGHYTMINVESWSGEMTGGTIDGKKVQSKMAENFANEKLIKVIQNGKNVYIYLTDAHKRSEGYWFTAIVNPSVSHTSWSLSADGRYLALVSGEAPYVQILDLEGAKGNVAPVASFDGKWIDGLTSVVSFTFVDANHFKVVGLDTSGKLHTYIVKMKSLSEKEIEAIVSQ